MKPITKTLAAVALTPWWLAQLATSAKSFRDNPVIGNPTLNRWGLHVARRRIAARLAALRRGWLARTLDQAEIAAFEREGYFIWHDALPREAFAKLRDEVAALHVPAREMRQGCAVTRRIGLDAAQLETMPACREFVKDPELLAHIHYAASYGGEPTFCVQSIIADPSLQEVDPQTIFHSDTFHPTAKAWLFLEDVGPADGPFAYVPGSHRLTPKRLDWEYAQSLGARHSGDEMHAEGSFRVEEGELSGLELPPPERFAVPANTLIIADTSGFHARTPSAHATCRVEIYATLRRAPFAPWTGAHALAFAPISGRHTALHAALADALERIGAGRSPWRPVGPTGAFDPPST